MACVVLVFSGGTTVDLEALRDDGEKFIIYAVLGKLRPGPRDAIYRALLSANLPTGDGAGAVIALDVERDEVISAANSRRRVAQCSLSR